MNACKRGHERNDENARLNTQGAWVCRVCARLRDKNYKQIAIKKLIPCLSGVKCMYEGCTRMVINKYGLCEDHRLYKCAVSSCKKRIARPKMTCEKHKNYGKPHALAL